MRLADQDRMAATTLTLLVVLLLRASSAAAETACPTGGTDFNVGVGVTCSVSPGVYKFSVVRIEGTVKALTDVSAGSYVTIIANDGMTITATGVIHSDGLGHSAGAGPGTGVTQGSSGSGGRRSRSCPVVPDDIHNLPETFTEKHISNIMYNNVVS